MPFFASLAPNERARAELPYVRTPALGKNEFAYVAHPKQADVDLLFIKDARGTLRVWWIPKSHGKVVLPDLHWWRFGPTCGDFSPNFNTNELRCSDAKENGLARDFRWSLDGKALYSGLDDMIAIDGFEENDFFIIRGFKDS